MVDSTESYDRAIEAAGTAAAKGDLASIEQAETLYRKALTTGERARGPFDVSLVPALTGLGAALLQQGSTDDAMPILTRAVRVSRVAAEVLRTLAANNVGGIGFTAPIRNLGFEDQQDKLDWVEGSGTLNIVSGATNGVSGPHGGSWYGRVQASTTLARHIHTELDLTAWVTGDQIDHDRVAVELAGWLGARHGKLPGDASRAARLTHGPRPSAERCNAQIICTWWIWT